MKLKTQIRILRRTVSDLRKRIKIAEIAILMDDKDSQFLLGRKLAKRNVRIRELKYAYRQAKADYEKILDKFDLITKAKKCSVCLEKKPIESFEKDPRMPTGRAARCNECNNNRTNKYRKTAKVFRELIEA